MHENDINFLAPEYKQILGEAMLSCNFIGITSVFKKHMWCQVTKTVKRC